MEPLIQQHSKHVKKLGRPKGQVIPAGAVELRSDFTPLFIPKEDILTPDNQNVQTDTTFGIQNIEIFIDGMSCAACTGKVEKKLAKLHGVRQVSVSLVLANAKVSLDEDSGIDSEFLCNEVRKLGYTCKPGTCNGSQRLLFYKISGKNLNRNEILERVAETLRVNFEVENVTEVTQSSDSPVNEVWIQVLRGARPCGARDCLEVLRASLDGAIVEFSKDNPASLVSEQSLDARHKSEIRRNRRAFLVALGFTGPLIFFSMGLLQVPVIAKVLTQPLWKNVSWDALIMLLLCTPVQFYCGFNFYKSMVRQNMCTHTPSSRTDFLMIRTNICHTCTSCHTSDYGY